MHPETLTDRQRESLEVLNGAGLLSRFYLAGGTAVALHLGHRRSLDFDLFTADPFEPLEVIDRLQNTVPLEIRRRSQAAVHLTLNGVPVTFLHYPYPLLEPLTEGPCRLRVAEPGDLAAMKLVAVSQRGTRKDFIDLFCLCQAGTSLASAFELVRVKFTKARFDWYHILNSLQYFDDADQQDLPPMLTAFDWEECKAYFRQVVPSLARDLLR